MAVLKRGLTKPVSDQSEKNAQQSLHSPDELFLTLTSE